MPKQTTLELDFFDVYHNRLKDKLDIFLKHTILMSTSYRKRNHDGSNPYVLSGIDFTQGGRYELLVSSQLYSSVHQFVRVFENKETVLELVFPTKASKVVGIKAPAYGSLGSDLTTVLGASEVESFPGLQGEDLYRALDDSRKAGLLNLYAKMSATVFRLPTPKNAFAYVKSFTRLRGDRFFAHVDKTLRDEIKNSQTYKLFHKQPGAAHQPPPKYQLVDSYKTLEKYGNLQVTFFNNPETLDYIADVDIDDAQGIEHIFQVVDHFVTGNETNPFEIHEILLAYQKIDPQYTLMI